MFIDLSFIKYSELQYIHFHNTRTYFYYIVCPSSLKMTIPDVNPNTQDKPKLNLKLASSDDLIKLICLFIFLYFSYITCSPGLQEPAGSTPKPASVCCWGSLSC